MVLKLKKFEDMFLVWPLWKHARQRARPTLSSRALLQIILYTHTKGVTKEQ